MAYTNAQVAALVRGTNERLDAITALLTARSSVAVSSVAAPAAASPVALVATGKAACPAHPEHGPFSAKGMAYHRTWCTGTVDENGKAITVKA